MTLPDNCAILGGTSSQGRVNMSQSPTAVQGPDTQKQLDTLDQLLDKMANARSFARANHLPRVLDLCRRILKQPVGFEGLYQRARKLDQAGVFDGSDWANPESLQSRLVPETFKSDDIQLVVIEVLSEIRMLAISEGSYFHPHLSAEHARHFLTQVLAFNLQDLFDLAENESGRGQSKPVRRLISQHLKFIAEHVGLATILDQVIAEVWRLLRQRPIQVSNIQQMINHIAACLFDPNIQVSATARGAERLVSAVYGPTQGCQEDPGITAYEERLQSMDAMALDSEAQGLSRAMHDTGLVSPYHAAFIRHALAADDTERFSRALGLSSTGRDCMMCYRHLVTTLTDYCIHVETAQSILGLAGLLERGLLYQPSIAAALWRQLNTPLHKSVATQISNTFGQFRPPHEVLMAGIISALGQPLGLGQGNNPACQSTRAISMWSYTDPNYLLQLVRWAARDNELVMQFEGDSINSGDLHIGMVDPLAFDMDPLSTLLVPHLDRIYAEMGRRVEPRGEDPHRWINPEFHGWWVNRGFAIAVDVQTGLLADPEGFVSTFYALYHPYYNSNTPVVHPQPAGIAITDSSARFVGWHAITILRIALDQEEEMRVYFFNPNNDGGQDWGNGVEVSTEGHGEQHGESSLPIAQFVSRLYIFHYDATDWQLHTYPVPEEEVTAVCTLMRDSWGVDRLPTEDQS